MAADPRRGARGSEPGPPSRQRWHRRSQRLRHAAVRSKKRSSEPRSGLQRPPMCPRLGVAAWDTRTEVTPLRQAARSASAA